MSEFFDTDNIDASAESVSDSATNPRHLDKQSFQGEEARRPREPLLPNAGAKEREYVTRLRELWWDKSLDMLLREEAGRYAKALQECLPTFEQMPIGNQRVTLPGCYYSRQAVTTKTNKPLFNTAMKLMIEATAKQDCLKQWFAQYLLDGMPKAVSNFKMDCRHLVRGPDGKVTRLVQFMNMHGEESRGNEIGGTVRLPNEMYSARKFPIFVWSRGNFVWSGGSREFQLLQWDVCEQAAFREVQGNAS